MNLAAHQAAVTPAPTCPVDGCGRAMQPNPNGVYGCDHTDTPVPAYDLTVPRPDAKPNHEPRAHSGPFVLVDRGPLVLHPHADQGVKRGGAVAHG